MFIYNKITYIDTFNSTMFIYNKITYIDTFNRVQCLFIIK